MCLSAVKRLSLVSDILTTRDFGQQVGSVYEESCLRKEELLEDKMSRLKSGVNS